MFDNVVSRPGGRRRPLVIASVLFHAAALAALAVSAAWDVGKLPVDERTAVVAAFAMPSNSGGGGAPAKTKVEARKEPPKRKIKDTVQPVQKVEPAATTAAEEAPLTTADGDGTGDGTTPGDGGGGDGRGTGTPDCEGADCSNLETGTGTAKKKIVEEPPPEPVVLAPNVASGLRIAGNDHIVPPNNVRTSMVREGKSQLVGAVKLCLGATGRVDSAKVLRSTGHDAYDRVLLQEMRQWRYKPYRVDGKGVPACTVVTVIYKVK